MKDLVRLPSVFLLAFILLFLAAVSLGLLAAWGSLLSAGTEPQGQALAPALARLPAVARGALPASVLGALLVLLMRIARRPDSRLLSLLLPPACAFVLLVLGYQGLQLLDAAWPKRSEPAAASLYIAPELFTEAGPRVIYARSLEAREASGIVIRREAGSVPRLRYESRGQLAVGEQTVALRVPGEAVEWPKQSVFAPLFAPHPTLRPFFSHLGVLDEELARQFAQHRGIFVLSCLALAVSACGAGVLLRLSRWYLLNACLTLAAFRGLLALFALLSQGGAARLGEALGGGALVRALPASGLLLVGVLLLLLDLLFVPFGREREGLTGA